MGGQAHDEHDQQYEEHDLQKAEEQQHRREEENAWEESVHRDVSFAVGGAESGVAPPSG